MSPSKIDTSSSPFLLYSDSQTGKLFQTIDDENITLFAIKNYTNNLCLNTKEFYDDFNKSQVIQKQVSRFVNSGQLNERLFLNNVICFFNVFEKEAAKLMLIYKCRRTYEHLSIIKTTMYFLSFFKEDELPQIPINQNLYQRLDQL